MLNVLLIDDIQSNLDVLETILEKDFTFNTHSVLSGSDALKILVKNNIDIIITDLMMPNMDGLELTRIIKQNTNTKHIPILVVTASSDEKNELALYKEGVFDYLTKPIIPEKLINKMKILTYTILENSYKDKLIKEQNKVKESTKEFINIFTHELRTPLNLIYNFSSHMKKKFIRDKIDKEKFTKYLASIEQSSENMLNTINSMLTIGKMEKGHKLIINDTIDLIQVIKDMIDIFELTLQNENIELDFSSNKNEILLTTNLESFKGIINNIIANAIKYGKDTILISLEET